MTNWAVVLWLATATLAQTAAPKCKMWEHQCQNGRCVALNRFCNNINDCGDSSDEPRHCTRKYMGLLSLIHDAVGLARSDGPRICVIEWINAELNILRGTVLFYEKENKNKTKYFR